MWGSYQWRDQVRLRENLSEKNKTYNIRPLKKKRHQLDAGCLNPESSAGERGPAGSRELSGQPTGPPGEGTQEDTALGADGAARQARDRASCYSRVAGEAHNSKHPRELNGGRQRSRQRGAPPSPSTEWNAAAPPRHSYLETTLAEAEAPEPCAAPAPHYPSTGSGSCAAYAGRLARHCPVRNTSAT